MEPCDWLLANEDVSRLSGDCGGVMRLGLLHSEWESEPCKRGREKLFKRGGEISNHSHSKTSVYQVINRWSQIQMFSINRKVDLDDRALQVSRYVGFALDDFSTPFQMFSFFQYLMFQYFSYGLYLSNVFFLTVIISQYLPQGCNVQTRQLSMCSMHLHYAHVY